MKCACICNCTKDADDSIEPELCIGCRLCESISRSAKPKHGLPYVPTVWPKLEPLAPITNDQKGKAIEAALEGLI